VKVRMTQPMGNVRRLVVAERSVQISTAVDRP
jgi:hypothetical protein